MKPQTGKDKQIKKNRQYQAAEKSVTGSIKELCDNLDQVGSTIGGTVGEVVSLIGQIGSVTMASIQGFETAANASSKAISTLEKASVILTIISSAYQIASKIIPSSQMMMVKRLIRRQRKCIRAISRF